MRSTVLCCSGCWRKFDAHYRGVDHGVSRCPFCSGALDELGVLEPTTSFDDDPAAPDVQLEVVYRYPALR